MRLVASLIPLFTLLALALPIQASGGVHVTVAIGDHYHLLPASKTCPVVVPAGASAGDALDAAVATGCLTGWTYDSYEGFGRYVVSIEGRAQDGTYFWIFSENGATASYGIDSASAAEGDVFEFNLGLLPAFFLP